MTEPSRTPYGFAAAANPQVPPDVGQKNEMIKKAKKWWFAIPLPAALIISYAIWEIRMWCGPGGFDDVLECAGPIALIGALLFPIGLAGVVWLPQDMITQYMHIIAFLGYALYLALSIIGSQRPARGILIVLCVLLLLNMAGCQMDHTVNSIPFE